MTDLPATQHGAVILDLVLHSPLFSSRDLIPLRGVSKSYRDRIDQQLFQHVFISGTKDGLLVCDEKKRKLPGFQTARNTAKDLDVLSRLQHTKVIDIPRMSRGPLVELNQRKLLDNVHTVRLLSSTSGRHMYQPPTIGSARTMVVFPPLVPQYDGAKMRSRTVPPGITKLVQHPACAVDEQYEVSRGPILFNSLGPDVTQEVWVFTNYGFKVSERRLGLYEDEAWMVDDALSAKLCATTVKRLNSGQVDLTLVDGHNWLANLSEAYKVYLRPEQSRSSGVSKATTVPERIRELLTARGAKDVSKLHISTFNEYSATITEEEKSLEVLPKSVSSTSAQVTSLTP